MRNIKVTTSHGSELDSPRFVSKRRFFWGINDPLVLSFRFAILLPVFWFWLNCLNVLEESEEPQQSTTQQQPSKTNLEILYILTIHALKTFCLGMPFSNSRSREKYLGFKISKNFPIVVRTLLSTHFTMAVSRRRPSTNDFLRFFLQSRSTDRLFMICISIEMGKNILRLFEFYCSIPVISVSLQTLIMTQPINCDIGGL